MWAVFGQNKLQYVNSYYSYSNSTAILVVLHDVTTEKGENWENFLAFRVSNFNMFDKVMNKHLNLFAQRDCSNRLTS